MNSKTFDNDYQLISCIWSPEFSKYMDSYMLKKKDKWAYEYRMNIKMYKKTNSNMLIESFHNILKTKFFGRKVNRRIDRLLYVLTVPLQAHYARKELRNGYGLNGPTCSERTLKKETELASQIPEDNIKILERLLL